MQAEIEQLKRRGGAAPFSKGKRKSDPKAPGRKPGQGYFRFRTAPEEAAATEAIVVPVTEPCCPDCGGKLGKVCREMVSITDIPVQPQPEIEHYAVEVRQCRRCGGKVRGRHPGITVGQHGATAHRLGPRVKALAHILHYVHGVPVRRTPAILAELTGVRLTQSAITQDAMKQTGGAVGARYDALRGARVLLGGGLLATTSGGLPSPNASQTRSHSNSAAAWRSSSRFSFVAPVSHRHTVPLSTPK